MNTLSLIVLTVLVLSFGTLQARPQHGVDLDSGAMGGGAEAGARSFGGHTGAMAGAQGGAAESRGLGTLSGGELLSVSSGAHGGMSRASAGTRGGEAAGARVQAVGGAALAGADVLATDGGLTRAGSGSSGGTAQAAADTAGENGRVISGAMGGLADSGAEVLSADGTSTKVGTGASGGASDAGVVKIGDVANVHSGALGGGAGSAAGLAETSGEDAGTPPVEEQPTVVVIAPVPVAVDEGFVYGEEPAPELTAEGDYPVELPTVQPVVTPAITVVGAPNDQDSPIEVILVPAENPNGEVKVAEDLETHPVQIKPSGIYNIYADALDKRIEDILDVITQENPEAAPEAAAVNVEADV